EGRPHSRRTETRYCRNSHAASSRVRRPAVARQLRQFLYREWRGAGAGLQRSERSHGAQRDGGTVPDTRNRADLLRRSHLGIRRPPLYDAAATGKTGGQQLGRLMGVPFLGTVLVVPPSDKLRVFFVAHPDNILPNTRVTTENDRLHIPLYAATKAGIRAEAQPRVREGKRREILWVRGNGGHRTGLPRRVSENEIVPTAQPQHLIAGE